MRTWVSHAQTMCHITMQHTHTLISAMPYPDSGTVHIHAICIKPPYMVQIAQLGIGRMQAPTTRRMPCAMQSNKPSHKLPSHHNTN